MFLEIKGDELTPLYIEKAELGIFELSQDEQLCKAIFEATGDKTFKGFLPLTWNTKQITRLRDAEQKTRAQGITDAATLATQMNYLLPDISKAATVYFLSNEGNIKGAIQQMTSSAAAAESNILKPLTPVLIVAGLAAAAIVIAQLAPLLPKRKPT